MRREGRGEVARKADVRMGPPPGQLIDTFRNLAKDLNLSEDQKTKVEAALKTAAEECKSLQGISNRWIRRIVATRSAPARKAPQRRRGIPQRGASPGTQEENERAASRRATTGRRGQRPGAPTGAARLSVSARTSTSSASAKTRRRSSTRSSPTPRSRSRRSATTDVRRRGLLGRRGRDHGRLPARRSARSSRRSSATSSAS
jgi:hypothetical protein